MIPTGPSGIIRALPGLLAALGEQLPNEPVPLVQPQALPISDLLLRLTDPHLDTEELIARVTATATLTYFPPDGGRAVESKRFAFTTPFGLLETDEIAWYLERYVDWPSGPFQERARRVEEALPRWGRLLYDTLNTDVARPALTAWNTSPQQFERRFTVNVDKELLPGVREQAQKDAEEAAAFLLSLPWELIHDEGGFLFQGACGVRVRRSLPSRDQQRAVPTDAPIRILLVSPRPEDELA